MTRAILYSYRRCPYAMRARLALNASHIPYTVREINLRDKPSVFTESFNPATVPQLVLVDKTIGESIDIVNWALSQSDADAWLHPDTTDVDLADCLAILTQEIICHVNASKKVERTPSVQQPFLEKMRHGLHDFDRRLHHRDFLCGDRPSNCDLISFPSLRQACGRSDAWFDQQKLPNLKRWLTFWLTHPLFHKSMQKYDDWYEGGPEYTISH